MSENYFRLLNRVFVLMANNKLRKDIDDTLLEKLLTSIEKHQQENTGFIKELSRKTEAYDLIQKILSSFTDKTVSYPILIKSFAIKLLGLIYTSSDSFFAFGILLPFLKFPDENHNVEHIPSIQDALLYCLSCIAKKYSGVRWFIHYMLHFSILEASESKSYYVRKSSVNFLVNFISQWAFYKIPHSDHRIAEDHIANYVEDVISDLIDHIEDPRNPKQIVCAKSCISVFKQLLEKNVEFPVYHEINFEKFFSKCFRKLTDDSEFTSKLIDLYVDLHLKFALSPEAHMDIIKYLIDKENMSIVMDLTSLFTSVIKSEHYSTDGLNLYLMPFHNLMVTLPCVDDGMIFEVKACKVHEIIVKKMENKEECKILIISSLSALQKVAPHIGSENQKILSSEVLKFVKSTDDNSCSVTQHHKWLYSILKDMTVHQSFIDLFSSLLIEEVYISIKHDGSDLIFLSILEFLKKSNSHSNFTCQLLLLMKKLLILHEKYQFGLKEAEKNELSEIVCRKLNDYKESVVDSALILAGWMITSKAWQGNVSKSRIHSIIWDIAVKGKHDGSVRSTALKALIEGCLDSWCLNELKSLQNVTEADIVKILFDMMQDPDFYLQREALSCLSLWMKSKWNDVQPPAKEQLFCALLTAVKSLDLELKLIALDVWAWLLENKFIFPAISPSSEVKDYVEYLANSGFGLSVILAFEDYDSAVQFKAASILKTVKNILLSKGKSFESLIVVSSDVDTAQKCDTDEYIAELTSKEKKEEGIENVLEISTADQIAKICLPEEFTFMYGHFPLMTVDRKCSISSFWISVWSENVETILKSSDVTDTPSDESLLNDIISAGILEYDNVEDTPDCY